MLLGEWLILVREGFAVRLRLSHLRFVLWLRRRITFRRYFSTRSIWFGLRVGVEGLCSAMACALVVFILRSQCNTFYTFNQFF